MRERWTELTNIMEKRVIINIKKIVSGNGRMTKKVEDDIFTEISRRRNNIMKRN